MIKMNRSLIVYYHVSSLLLYRKEHAVCLIFWWEEPLSFKTGSYSGYHAGFPTIKADLFSYNKCFPYVSPLERPE